MPRIFPSELSAELRFRELAGIFAVGVQRLRRRNGTPSPSETAAETFAGRLEVSPDTVLSVTNPVNGPESPTLGAPA